MEVKIRSLVDDDCNFLYNSWLLSFKESYFARQIPAPIYFPFHNKVIKNILARKSTTVIIACDRSQEDIIRGYAVFEEIEDYKIFHYIYVKRPFNGNGIAGRLIKESPFPITFQYASHVTPKGKKIIYENGIKYCPYLT